MRPLDGPLCLDESPLDTHRAAAITADRLSIFRGNEPRDFYFEMGSITDAAIGVEMRHFVFRPTMKRSIDPCDVDFPLARLDGSWIVSYQGRTALAIGYGQNPVASSINTRRHKVLERLITLGYAIRAWPLHCDAIT